MFRMNASLAEMLTEWIKCNSVYDMSIPHLSLWLNMHNNNLASENYHPFTSTYYTVGEKGVYP